MQKIRLACETYSWEMASQSYKDKLKHIMGIIQQAGFAGIEAETSFFGDLSDPIKMKAALDEYQLELAVLCHVEDWRNATETIKERANADRWIQFLEHFPNTIYLLVQMPGADRNNLVERQQNLLSCVNTVAERAAARGIECSYHPNSPAGSIYRTEEDYKILLNGLDRRYLGYTPDVGHIAKGGMDPLSICKEYRELINLVHYKDMYADGQWAPTGEGVIDFASITSYLVDTGFAGWIIMEDEDETCITDPDGVTIKDGVYIDQYIRPLLP